MFFLINLVQFGYVIIFCGINLTLQCSRGSRCSVELSIHPVVNIVKFYTRVYVCIWFLFFLRIRNAGEAMSDFACFIMFARVSVCLIAFSIQLQFYFICVSLIFLYGKHSVR